AEVFLSIGILFWRGVPVEPYWEAVETARAAAELETGVRLRWIFDAVRQFGVDHVDRVVQWAAQNADAPAALGIGIGGDEAGGPASWFAASFARARDAGLRLTVHAGETCGPDSVWAAIAIGAERIGHGLRAFEDPALVETLAARGISLDICPTSNLRTGAWRLDRPYPALQYREAGVRCAIGTDDPGIFECDLLGEYEFLHHSGGFSGEDLESLARNSFKCSFLSEAERRAMASLPLLSAPDPGRDRGVGIE
ncbi:MAG TPA: hypothetical protein VN515_01980, partial [Terriglobales bacterium]|nr:hypothetical protein [Terriglobales bacterium]